MKRRDFILTGALSGATFPFLFSCAKRTVKQKMIVLGIDGLDPSIVRQLMRKGEMPNMEALARQGIFTMMHSSIPPQSPVAWASFSTGNDPGVHGIFDFVHRDPKTYFPKFSLSEHLEPKWVMKLGKYQLPLKAGKMTLQREGKPFWDYLQDHGIGATIFKVPSNFPPSPSRQNTLAGMGTPDILGGNGIYTLFTNDEEEYQKDLSPHRIYYADIDENDTIKNARLDGPPNSLIQNSESIPIFFNVYLDNINRTVRIDVQGKEILLAEKEYSDWVEIEFPLLGNLESIKAMVRFYLLEMGKRFRLYVSPIQINPRNPALPISTPSGYSRVLAKRNGLFHTLGFPADFNAIKTGTFSIENFIVQSQSVFDESERIFYSELARFQESSEGFFFFYFSSLDQGQHIFWALTDPAHPFFHPQESKSFNHVRLDYYRRCDRILGKALKEIPKDTKIMVISDHGFAPFYKKVNLNNWLLNEGYLYQKRGESPTSTLLASTADWARSRAYGLGLNGLYLNMKDREGEGIVTQGNRRKLLTELKAKLEDLTDSTTGAKIVSRAFISEDCFSPNRLDRAPDIVIGFNRGYRSDDRFGEGGLSRDLISENMSWWSGDHCIDPFKVPATFIANFPINQNVPNIMDLAPTILRNFNIIPPREMKGKPLI